MSDALKNLLAEERAEERELAYAKCRKETGSNIFLDLLNWGMPRESAQKICHLTDDEVAELMR